MKQLEILMASYNGEKYIAEQIESILHQTDSQWHLTISDDGSTDRTVDIIEAYQQQYPNKICRVRSGRRFGNAKMHFFWLLKNCNADYICFCDQDDVWKPDKVQKSMEAMKKAESVSDARTPILVFSDLRVVDENLNLIAESIMYLQQQKAEIADYRELLFKNVANGNTMLINRPLIERSLRCTAPEGTMMHDWWIAIVAARFGKTVFVDDQTVLYRQHGDNDVGAKKARGLAFILSKLLNYRKFNDVLNKKAKQAGVFLDTFAAELGQEECTVLDAYAKRKMPLPMKWQYLRWMTSFSRKVGFLLAW